MQKNKRKVGAFYEEIAADYLVSQGVMILERELLELAGEIDPDRNDCLTGWLIFVGRLSTEVRNAQEVRWQQ